MGLVITWISIIHQVELVRLLHFEYLCKQSIFHLTCDFSNIDVTITEGVKQRFEVLIEQEGQVEHLKNAMIQQ